MKCTNSTLSSSSNCSKLSKGKPVSLTVQISVIKTLTNNLLLTPRAKLKVKATTSTTAKKIKSQKLFNLSSRKRRKDTNL